MGCKLRDTCGQRCLDPLIDGARVVAYPVAAIPVTMLIEIFRRTKC